MKKNKNRTVTILLEFALLIGLAGGFYMLQLKQIEPTTVYQYARDLKESTVIKASDIAQVTIPRDAVTSTMVLDPNEIIGKAVDSNVYVGDYITTAALIEAEDIDIFTIMNLSDYRQVALEVSRRDMMGGDLEAGETVDLAYVANASADGHGEILNFTYSTIFMEDVLVYKVLTSTGEEYVNNTNGPVYDEDGNEIFTNPSTVVLAVTADQAEEILARLNTGSIKLVGRFETSEDVNTSGYVIGDYGQIPTYFANPED